MSNKFMVVRGNDIQFVASEYQKALDAAKTEANDFAPDAVYIYGLTATVQSEVVVKPANVELVKR